MPGVIDLRQDVAVDMANAQAIGNIFKAVGRAEQNRQKRFQIDRVMSDISNGIDPMTAVQNSRTAGPVPFSEGLAGVGQRFGRLLGGTPDATEDLTEQILMGKLTQSIANAGLTPKEIQKKNRIKAGLLPEAKNPPDAHYTTETIGNEIRPFNSITGKIGESLGAAPPKAVTPSWQDIVNPETGVTEAVVDRNNPQNVVKAPEGYAFSKKPSVATNIQLVKGEKTWQAYDKSKNTSVDTGITVDKPLDNYNIQQIEDGSLVAINRNNPQDVQKLGIKGKISQQTSAQDKLVATRMDILLKQQGMALTNPNKAAGDKQWLEMQAEIDELTKYYDNVGKTAPAVPAATTPATPTTATGATPAPTTDFERRMTDPNALSIKNPDGTVSTHKMAWATDDKGAFAYPTIVSLGGALKELSPKEAMDYALKTGELKRFSTPEEAESYAAGSWKKSTPTAATGEKAPTPPASNAQVRIMDGDKVVAVLPQPPSGQVVVRDKDGNFGSIPREDVEKAMRNGYTVYDVTDGK